MILPETSDRKASAEAFQELTSSSTSNGQFATLVQPLLRTNCFQRRYFAQLNKGFSKCVYFDEQEQSSCPNLQLNNDKSQVTESSGDTCDTNSLQVDRKAYSSQASDVDGLDLNSKDMQVTYQHGRAVIYDPNYINYKSLIEVLDSLMFEESQSFIECLQNPEEFELVKMYLLGRLNLPDQRCQFKV